MNIHEHQAKNILRKYGAKVPDGVYALDVNELLEKAVQAVHCVSTLTS